MALVGYQMEKQKIDEKIRQIEARLGGKHAGVSPAQGQAKAKVVKRILSPEARKRIAAAQKKRWAEHRKKMAAGKSE
jgi:starvation-inducible outer membrane lipoprotein